MEYRNSWFRKLNKISPPLLEHLAREKKTYVITSRPLPFALPLGHEPFGRELRVEGLEAEWLRVA